MLTFRSPLSPRDNLPSYKIDWAVKNDLYLSLFQLYVEVLDVNDNEPVFSHRLYRANVSERCRVGQHVLRVSATDRDKDDRLLYSIASAASTTSLRKFRIGPMNGEIGMSLCCCCFLLLLLFVCLFLADCVCVCVCVCVWQSLLMYKSLR